MQRREFSDWFAEYARVIVENFSDRVKYFMTFNEPQCIVGGYQSEERAPGLNLPLAEVIPLVHYMLLAHGKAVDAMKKYAKQEIKITFAPTGFTVYPATESEEDIVCARKAMMDTYYDHMWWSSITLYADPIMLGKYPQEALDRYEQYLPEGWKDDLKQIHRPLDFYCYNYYQSCKISAKEGFMPRKTGAPINSAGWAIEPKGIRWGTRFIYERYGVPIYISENGVPGHDWVSDDGKVYDRFRIDFIKWHIDQIEKAIADGIDIRGYFYWSIMDNFEWAEGYKERFGLIFVDYNTQHRTIKESGFWYGDLIKKYNKGER